MTVPLGPTGKAGTHVKGYNVGQIQQFTPEQMELYSGLFQHLGPESYLSKLAMGMPETYAETEAPALRQFARLQGNLASRFSGMGAGSRRSSGFQNTMNQAASDFSQQLQSQRMQNRMNAIQELMQFSNMLMGQRPYETTMQEKSSPWEDLLSGFGGAASKQAGKKFGGWLGGLV